MKKKALVLAIYIACSTPNSGKAKNLAQDFSGLNLGEVKSHSSQGEPFHGIIPILLARPDQAKKLNVKVASSAVFSQLGIEKKHDLDYLSFTIKTYNKKPVIVISSSQPIHLPVLNFILEIKSSKNVVYQAYSVMLKAPRTTAKKTQKRQSKKHPKTYFSPQVLTKKRLKHRVKTGDTLLKIAQKYKHNRISLKRMMKSIYSVNPKAFIHKDINKIKKGYILQIPSAKDINNFDIIAARANAEHQEKNLSHHKKRISVNTYKVRRGDTLSKITKKFLYEGASFTRMMGIIHKNNPHSFNKSNIHALKIGTYLRIPTYSEVVEKRQQRIRTLKSNQRIPRNLSNKASPQKTERSQATVDKLQKSIDKLSRPKKITSVYSKTKQHAQKKNKSYSSEELATLYKQAFGKKKTKNKINASRNDQNTDLAALYAKAFGKKQNIASPSEVIVELRVNKTTIDEITLYSNKTGQLDQVETKPFLKILKNILKKHIYKRLHKKISKNKRINISKLSTEGINAAYNPVNLSLDLIIKPELRKPRVLSLQKNKSVSVRKENKLIAEEISGFINMYSNTSIFLSEKNKTDLKIKLEGSLGIKDTVLESSIDINKQSWKAGKTTLTYDKPDKLQRFVLGNISTGNRNFQENLELTGLRASKEFFMDPNLQIRPKANESFILETESEVEVFTNNQLRQRFYLDKGVYSLEDIGLNNGENNIRIKITDTFGKVTIKTSQQYYDSHLLKPDLSLYSFSVGYLDNKNFKENNKPEKSPILSGYYEQGISENLTMSLDAQLSSENYLLGSEAITSFSLGSLKNSFAISGGRDKKTGFATRFEFKPNIYRDLIELDTLKENTLGLDQKVKHFINSWTISGEYRNKNFSMISQQERPAPPSSKQLQSQLKTQFSLDLSKQWRGTVSFGVEDYYNADKKASVNLSAIKRLKNGGRIRLGANYDTDDDFSINLQFSMPLWNEENHTKKNKSMEVLVSSKEQAYSSKLNVAATSDVGINSLSGSLEYNHDKTSNRQRLNYRYRDVNYETSLSAINIDKLNNDSSNNQQINIGFNTSIACIGSNCATSYPINDSFALVSAPENQEKPIAVKNGQGQFNYTKNPKDGLPDKYTSIIPGKGKKAVVPLESYRYQNINIDESSLPEGYDSEKTEFEVFPRYHQGFLVKAGGEPATIISGELVDKENKALPFKGGQWIPLNGNDKTIAFFSNKAGLFYLNSVPAGKYKLELFDYPDMDTITINVPDKKGKLHKLGKIVVNTE